MISIYSNSKFKVIYENKETISNFQHCICYFAFLSKKQKKKYSPCMVILSTLEPTTTLDETIRCTSKWFILTSKMQNLELVNLKCVSFAQPIPLSLNML